MIDQRRVILGIGVLVLVGAGGVPAVGAAPADIAQIDWLDSAQTEQSLSLKP